MLLLLLMITKFEGELRKAATGINKILKIYDMKISTVSAD
jgi:hypothetical protein